MLKTSFLDYFTFHAVLVTIILHDLPSLPSPPQPLSEKKVSESLDKSWLGGVGGGEAAHQVQVEQEEVALPPHLRFQQAGR